ncbi:MAG: hypothetical protein JSS02_28515, partial [Planctomycetes bacterium]|nr:hypothetical protein [Planctomycetota bacterium]
GGIAAATITNGVTQSVLGNPLNGGNNEVEVFDFAVAKVGQFIQQSSVGQSSNGNVVGALFGGALSVGGGGVKMSVTNSNSLGIDVNELFAYEGGTFSTTGVIVMNSAITLGAETVARPLAGPIDFFTNGNLVGTSFGSISALGVQMNTSGTASQQNIVGIEDTIESGATAGDPVLSTINIGNSGIVMKDSGPGACLSQVLNYSNNAGSAINVTGSVNVTDTGSGTSEFDIVADSVGSITVGGVNYDNHLNTTTFSNVAILGNSPGNAHVTINGPLTIYLSQHVATPVVTANSLLGGLFPTNNLVELGNVDGDSGTGYGLVVKLNTSITGSNGEDDVHIDAAQFNSWVNVDLKTNAAFIPANPVLGVNTLGVGADYVDIEGSLFLNTATFTLAGDNAQIDINNGTSIQTTTFTRQFSAIMKGASPVINISAGSAFGYGSVVFSIGGVAYGTLGAGGVINYNPLNVSGSFVGYNFTKVQVP